MNNFRGGFGGGNMQSIMQQAQRMQEKMMKAQEELENTTVVGSAGGGMIEITLNGKKEFVSIKFKKEAVDPDDIEMLEDLVKVAFDDASKKADELSNSKMGQFGNLGGLF